MAGRSHHLFHAVLGLCGLGALIVSLCFLFPKSKSPRANPKTESPIAANASATETAPRALAPLPRPAADSRPTDATTPADPRFVQLRGATESGLLDRAPNRVEDVEGAAIVRQIAEGLTASADVVRLARSLSADPRMCELMKPMAEEWAASSDPVRHARGILFQAALDPTHTLERWQTAVDGERNDIARAALLEGAPLSGEAEADTRATEILIGAAQRDAVESVRSAAVRGLPTDLAAESTRRLAAGLERERSADVRRETLAVLGRLRTDDPRVVATLDRVAFDKSETETVRREAFGGLIRASNEHPGLLSEEALARIEKTLSELGRN